MESNDWNQREIFTSTPENPNHEYVFDNCVFNEVSSGKNGLYLMGANKVNTELLKDGSLIIRVFINNQFKAKDFCFDFIKKNRQVVFYRTYIKEKETDYFGFEVKE
jgi:hypothetical protein